MFLKSLSVGNPNQSSNSFSPKIVGYNIGQTSSLNRKMKFDDSDEQGKEGF